MRRSEPFHKTLEIRRKLAEANPAITSLQNDRR